MIDSQLLQLKLHQLEQEHKELNELIDDPNSIFRFSEFTFRRFKKRKLTIKDEIIRIKALLCPDIIA